MLIIGGLETLRTADLRGYSQLAEVFTAAAEARADAGLPCWIILDAPTRGIAHLPVQ